MSCFQVMQLLLFTCNMLQGFEKIQIKDRIFHLQAAFFWCPSYFPFAGAQNEGMDMT